MLKRLFFIILVIVLLMVASCSNNEVIKHNYTYMGENQSWLAVYKVNGTGIFFEKNGYLDYQSYSNTTLTVAYKKDISYLSSVKRLEISYESSAGGGKLLQNFVHYPLNEKTFMVKFESEGGAIENKDEIIKVNIDIDGKTQVIDLKNVQSSFANMEQYGENAVIDTPSWWYTRRTLAIPPHPQLPSTPSPRHFIKP